MNRFISIQILSIILIISTQNLKAQDAVLLINGKLLENKVLDIGNDVITIEKPKKVLLFNTKKTTVKKLSTVSVFSVYSNNIEKIIYKTDIDAGFTLNASDMQAFVYGEKWGRNNFNAPWATIFGFVAGAAGGYYQFWGAPVPVLASIAIGSTGPKNKHFNKMPIEYKDSRYFANGFKDYARKKKTINAIKGGFIGFFTSTIITSYLSNQDW